MGIVWVVCALIIFESGKVHPPPFVKSFFLSGDISTHFEVFDEFGVESSAS